MAWATCCGDGAPLTLRAIQSAGLVYVPLADEGTSTSMWLVHLREGGTLPCANFLGIMHCA